MEKNDFTKKEKKKKAAKGPNQRLRHRTAVLIVLILVIGFGAIVARLGYLTTIQSGKLQQAAVEQQLMDRKLPQSVVRFMIQTARYLRKVHLYGR